MNLVPDLKFTVTYVSITVGQYHIPMLDSYQSSVAVSVIGLAVSHCC